MRLEALILLAVVPLFAVSVSGDVTCSQLTSGQPSTEEEKRKAQLCQLAELADVLNGMANTLHEAMVAVLNEQGVSVDEASAADVEKRKNEYLRFGKRKHEYLRFGKRKNEYLRFGK